MKHRMAARIAALLFLPLFLLVQGCGRRQRTYEASLFAMDTIVTLRFELAGGTDPSEARRIEELCRESLGEAESVLSAHLENSPVYRFNHNETDSLPLHDPLLRRTAEAAWEVMRATGDAFDCTLGPLSDLWNVAGGGPVPSPEAIRTALLCTGRNRYEMTEEALFKKLPAAYLDFGAIGKGAAAERLAQLLRERETLSWALLSLGGNVVLVGEKPDGTPFRVGVKDPRRPDGLLGTLTLRSGFVSVSGNYERYFEEDGVRYCHIFDGKTGYPADSGLISAAVIADDGVLADALSTALFVMGEEDALAFYASGPYAFEAVLVSEDGGVTVTPGLKDAFSLTAEGYFPKP